MRHKIYNYLNEILETRKLRIYRHLTLPTSFDPRKKTRPFWGASTYCNYSLKSNIAIYFSLTATYVTPTKQIDCYNSYSYIKICGERTICVDWDGSICTCCVMTAVSFLSALFSFGTPVWCCRPPLQFSQLVV